MSLKCLSIYMDYSQDESYTPAKFSVRAGTCYHDLQEVLTVEVNEPRGWEHIDLGACGKDGLLKVWLIQVCILLNHQNGKDTHVRKIRLYTPRDQQLDTVGTGARRVAEDEVGVGGSAHDFDLNSAPFLRGLAVR